MLAFSFIPCYRHNNHVLLRKLLIFTIKRILSSIISKIIFDQVSSFSLANVYSTPAVLLSYF